MKRNATYGIVFLSALGATCHGAVLMADYPLCGSQQVSTRWTNLSSSNPLLSPDSGRDGGGTVAVSYPGYGASIGFYSYTGPYAFTTIQTSAFDIENVVFQFEASVNESFEWPYNGGPTLTINIASGAEIVFPVSFAPGYSEVRSTFGDLEYTAYAWQWDLSSYEDEITSVTINAPISVHTSVMAAQIDVGDGYSAAALVPEPASSALCLAAITLFAVRRKRETAIQR